MTRIHLDVLELIVAHLDGTDLAAAGLVSRTFLAAALPALYARVEYTVRHAKRAHTVMSPFATLAAHDHLVVHVKHIALHVAPALNNIVSPTFLVDLTRALGMAVNLRVFVCTVSILPPLLPYLVDKHRLHHLRIAASLGSRQLSVLRDVSGLHSLSLDSPSWNIIDALPQWSASMQRTLAHLTLFMSQDLDATALNATLAQLPRLRGLHVIGCPRISHSVVLKALSHTPDLLELSFTIFPSQESVLPQLNFPIPPLTHLSIDVRASHPGLKPLVTRILSRLSPRVALAICGGWIGEIRGATESVDRPQDPPGQNGPDGSDPNSNGQNVHLSQNHLHLQGHADDPPLLSPPHAHPPPNHPPGPSNQGNHPPPTHIFGFHMNFPLGNPDDDDDNDPPGVDPPNPPGTDPHHDPISASLIAAFPSTLSILHLPLISPSGLREIIDRCDGIRVLGLVVGTSFASQPLVKSNRTNGRPAARSAARFKQARISGIRPEVSTLANILSRAQALRELIIDTTSIENGTATDPRSDGSHSAFRGTALLTPTTVRMLMRESPHLRRIVGEGRVWESPTPTPSLPVPFPHCLDIDLTLSRARYGPGSSNYHAYGPPSFGTSGGGYTQVEAENSHWFWLTGSASGGKGYNVF